MGMPRGLLFITPWALLSIHTGTDNVYAIANLALMTGNIGMESTKALTRSEDRIMFRALQTWAVYLTSTPAIRKLIYLV